MKTKALKTLIFTVLFLGIIANTAFADGSYTISTNCPSESVSFWVGDIDPPYVVPVAATVNGDWQEDWYGNPGATSELQDLYQEATLFNSPWYIDDIWPDATYNDGSTNVTYGISTNYDWTLQTPTNTYDEGYSNIFQDYDTGSLSVDGQVFVECDSATNPYQAVNYYWSE